MKKKTLALLLTAATMAATLAGCGSNAADGNSSNNSQTEDNTVNDGAQTDTDSQTNNQDNASEGGEEQLVGGDHDGASYKVGIVQYVDDASLNQIVAAVQAELDAKGAELGIEFDYADYTYNGQADSTVMNQIATDLIASNVDIIVPVATPTAMVMQNATAENPKDDGSLIPVVFSAVSDPVGAGLVESMDAPGSNITGTSDALDTNAIFDLMLAANPDISKVGLLYDKSQDSSTAAIADAKAYCEDKGIEVVEKTGTNNGEISLAADALVAAGVDAIFTPTDNNVMTAELAIYEKFIDAKVPHYAGADSFALNGAFMGYGVNYEELGTATADMVVEILVNGADPASTAVVTQDNGIATVNTETAEAIGLDYSMFESMCSKLVEIQTAEEFQ
ncbi:MAG: ABC transporter substrate-binding protein [Lachnospiraceae bacterium]|nr:ABC transporter substrate-binding protein [Lachnospiraceae bacterium]